MNKRLIFRNKVVRFYEEDIWGIFYKKQQRRDLFLRKLRYIFFIYKLFHKVKKYFYRRKFFYVITKYLKINWKKKNKLKDKIKRLRAKRVILKKIKKNKYYSRYIRQSKRSKKFRRQKFIRKHAQILANKRLSKYYNFNKKKKKLYNFVIYKKLKQVFYQKIIKLNFLFVLKFYKKKNFFNSVQHFKHYFSIQKKNFNIYNKFIKIKKIQNFLYFNKFVIKKKNNLILNNLITFFNVYLSFNFYKCFKLLKLHFNNLILDKKNIFNNIMKLFRFRMFRLKKFKWKKKYLYLFKFILLSKKKFLSKILNKYNYYNLVIKSPFISQLNSKILINKDYSSFFYSYNYINYLLIFNRFFWNNKINLYLKLFLTIKKSFLFLEQKKGNNLLIKKNLFFFINKFKTLNVLKLKNNKLKQFFLNFKNSLLKNIKFIFNFWYKLNFLYSFKNVNYFIYNLAITKKNNTKIFNFKFFNNFFNFYIFFIFKYNNYSNNSKYILFYFTMYNKWNLRKLKKKLRLKSFKCYKKKKKIYFFVKTILNFLGWVKRRTRYLLFKIRNFYYHKYNNFEDSDSIFAGLKFDIKKINTNFIKTEEDRKNNFVLLNALAFLENNKNIRKRYIAISSIITKPSINFNKTEYLLSFYASNKIYKFFRKLRVYYIKRMLLKRKNSLKFSKKINKSQRKVLRFYSDFLNKYMDRISRKQRFYSVKKRKTALQKMFTLNLIPIVKFVKKKQQYKSYYKYKMLKIWKIRKFYGNLTNYEFKRLCYKAYKYEGDVLLRFLILLEARLDTLLYRSGIASSIFEARQFINHNLVVINNKIINKRSYVLNYNDILTLNYEKVPSIIKNLIIRIYNEGLVLKPPIYLEINYNYFMILFLFEIFNFKNIVYNFNLKGSDLNTILYYYY